MSAHRFSSRSRFGVLVAALVALLVPLGLAGPAAAAVTSSFVQSEGLLLLQSDGADGIVLTCSGGEVKLGGADPLASPLACADVEVIVAAGGPGNNVIDLSGVRPGAFTQLRSTQLQGGGGNDTITGSSLGESLNGDAGGDSLTGGGGDDVVLGGDGLDTMTWNDGDGSDRIDGEGDPDNAVVNTSATGGDVVTVAPNGARTRVARTNLGAFSLDLGTTERVIVHSGGGNDTVAAVAGAAVALVFDGGEGNDSLTGGEREDSLRGGPGDDRIVGLGASDFVNGDEGDDTMIWNAADDVDGSGDDDVEGGSGVDTMEVNGSTGPDEFVVVPTSIRNIEFDVPSGLDISSSERVVVNGRGGDDTITGSKAMPQTMEFVFSGQAGNDTIEGTDRPDLLQGGAGFDVIGAIDAAADDVQCGSGSDLARVNSTDRPTNCERLEGPDPGRRVRLAGKAIRVENGMAAVKVRCVDVDRCHGKVWLGRDGRALGSRHFRASSRQVRVVRVKLSRRGRDLLASGSRDALHVVARIDAWDDDGNGWRTKVGARLLRG